MPRRLLPLFMLAGLLVVGCKGSPEAAIAPGETEASFHVEFSAEDVGKKAELQIRARLRAAGARSYQVWRSGTTVKVRVAAIRSAGDVEVLLSDANGQGGGPMAEFASVYPYPSAPTTVRPVEHRDE